MFCSDFERYKSESEITVHVKRREHNRLLSLQLRKELTAVGGHRFQPQYNQHSKYKLKLLT